MEWNDGMEYGIKYGMRNLLLSMHLNVFNTFSHMQYCDKRYL